MEVKLSLLGGSVLPGGLGFKGLGFWGVMVLGFRVLGFWFLGFRVLRFRVLGSRVYIDPEPKEKCRLNCKALNSSGTQTISSVSHVWCLLGVPNPCICTGTMK